MDFLDRTYKNVIPSDNYKSYTDDIKNYYLPDDEEIIKQHNPSLNNNIQIYKQKYALYIPSNTPRYECDILFRKIIDYCLQNNYTDNLNNNVTLVNPQMRKLFYKFIINNS